MEIIELLWALVQGCGCCLEFVALTADASAVVGARSYWKKRKAAEDEPGTPPPRSEWRLAGLLTLTMLATALTVLVILKWLGALTPPPGK
jgi:hypothetical protein